MSDFILEHKKFSDTVDCELGVMYRQQVYMRQA
jgi:hypothetical protein